MKLRFPYVVSTSLSLGNILTATFWLNVESPKGLIPFLFLFDTGADVTSFPASVAGKLGIDLDKCPEEPMSGYEGTIISVYRSEVRIVFNGKSFFVPCVFNPNEEVPILLGRAGILNRFNILLDGKRREIIFEEI